MRRNTASGASIYPYHRQRYVEAAGEQIRFQASSQWYLPKGAYDLKVWFKVYVARTQIMILQGARVWVG